MPVSDPHGDKGSVIVLSAALKLRFSSGNLYAAGFRVTNCSILQSQLSVLIHLLPVAITVICPFVMARVLCARVCVSGATSLEAMIMSAKILCPLTATQQQVCSRSKVTAEACTRTASMPKNMRVAAAP